MNECSLLATGILFLGLLGMFCRRDIACNQIVGIGGPDEGLASKYAAKLLVTDLLLFSCLFSCRSLFLSLCLSIVLVGMFLLIWEEHQCERPKHHAERRYPWEPRPRRVPRPQNEEFFYENS
jgi:hypothetical protein